MVFHTDYTDLERVLSCAKLIQGAVVKYPDRPNYNIIPDRADARLRAKQRGAIILWPRVVCGFCLASVEHPVMQGTVYGQFVVCSKRCGKMAADRAQTVDRLFTMAAKER